MQNQCISPWKRCGGHFKSHLREKNLRGHQRNRKVDISHLGTNFKILKSFQNRFESHGNWYKDNLEINLEKRKNCDQN